MGKKLNHYDFDEVVDVMRIDKIQTCFHLDTWLDVSGTLKPSHIEILDEIRAELSVKWDEWNEEELKINFIGLVFFVAQLEEPKKVRTFFERNLSGKVHDIFISVTVDCMLASPKRSGTPDRPYFFMQEFKRSRTDGRDPEGQMLAAMILAQEMNQDGHPLYGCWLQGKNWYFTVLNGVEYCVSRQYDATREPDLLQIVFILRKLKQLILARIA
jgi:hypothetical protein